MPIMALLQGSFMGTAGTIRTIQFRQKLFSELADIRSMIKDEILKEITEDIYGLRNNYRDFSGYMDKDTFNNLIRKTNDIMGKIEVYLNDKLTDSRYINESIDYFTLYLTCTVLRIVFLNEILFSKDLGLKREDLKYTPNIIINTINDLEKEQQIWFIIIQRLYRKHMERYSGIQEHFKREEDEGFYVFQFKCKDIRDPIVIKRIPANKITTTDKKGYAYIWPNNEDKYKIIKESEKRLMDIIEKEMIKSYEAFIIQKAIITESKQLCEELKENTI